MDKLIELKEVTKDFNGHVVLNKISLDIFENEFVTLLGPSGCGKTTILRIIGGFETVTSGIVNFSETISVNKSQKRRLINTVFQKYALFTHLNVFENVAFGLRIQAENEKKHFFKRFLSFKKDAELEKVIEEKVKKILKLVNLEGYENRSINKLSGGQQQRVAIARALINEPKVLLLDEPLAALDLKLRQEMQYELKDIQRNTKITFIFVTHDQEEALTMSDKIVVMNEGEIQQIGTPQEVYNEPINRFVAKFIGESNIINGIMLDDFLVRFDGVDVKCVDKGFKENEAVDVVIRPEDIDIVESKQGLLTGTVISVVFKGVHFEIEVKCDKRDYLIHTTDYHEVNKLVGLSFGANDIHIMRKI